MLSIIRKIVQYTSSSKGAKVTLTIWLAAVLVLSIFAPGSSDYETNSTEGSINENSDSEIAAQLEKSAFPSDDGLTALVVFHDEEGIGDSDKKILNLLVNGLPQMRNQKEYLVHFHFMNFQMKYKSKCCQRMIQLFYSILY